MCIGGSWITGSIYFNDFPTMEQLVFGNDTLAGWLLDIDLATPDGLDLFSDKNQYFFGSLLWSVIAKANQWMYVCSLPAMRTLVAVSVRAVLTRD